MIYPYKTAKTRNNPSKPCALFMAEVPPPVTVLDYGCGKGRDVLSLVEAGYDATGYDPHYFSEIPKGTFDVGLRTYVLNVIPNPLERSKVIEHMATMCRIVYIAVRNGRDFTQSKWEPFGDGYITSKNTFQVGIEEHTLVGMVTPYMEGVRVWSKGSTTFLRGSPKGT